MSDCPPSQLSRPLTLTPPPKRRPLAQHSESDANASKIRLVAQEGLDVYSKSPFPSHPSHVLPPKIAKLHPQRYAPFEDKDVLVSDGNTPTSRPAHETIHGDAPVHKPVRLRRSIRESTSTSTSDADCSTLTAATLTTDDTVLTTPLSSRHSSRTTVPSSPADEKKCEDREGRLDPVYEETILQFTHDSPLTRSTIRAIPLSTCSDRLPLGTKRSDSSLTPSTSTVSLQAFSEEGELHLSSPSSGNFKIYPHSSSEVSLPAGQGQDLELSPAPSIHSKPIHDHTSCESLVLQDDNAAANANCPGSGSFPPCLLLGTSAISADTTIAARYPITVAQSKSSSYAEVSSSAPTIQEPRMREDSYHPQQWSSRLSTIASESERSNSYSTSTNSARRGKRRKTIGSFTSGGPLSFLSDARSSEWECGSGVLTGTESNTSIPIPQPLFSPRPLPAIPDGRFSHSRDSDERDDIVGELQAPHLRSQRSGVLTKFSSKSSLRPSSAESNKSRGSQISFIGDLMWARRYYSNGEPANMIPRNNSSLSESSGTPRLHTSTSGITSSPVSETVPSNLWRPRNRPHDQASRSDRQLRQETRTIFRMRKSLHSAVISEDMEVTETQGDRRLRSRSTPELSFREMIHSPHLRRDRRQIERYSIWVAPSFDEPLSTAILSPINRQIFCFALGFILPVAWWVAAFLPLPQHPNPEIASTAANPNEGDSPPNSANPSEFSRQEKGRQKAQWWRRVNRVLALFGLVLVGTIVALAVIGTRGNGSNSSQPARTPIIVPLYTFNS